MSADRNRPTPEGEKLGRILAAVTDRAEPGIRAKFPSTAERCKSCAYRAGTFPNRCPETVLDAFACAITGETFWCHQRFNDDGSPRHVCGGFLVALGNVPTEIADLLKPGIEYLNAARAVAAKDDA